MDASKTVEYEGKKCAWVCIKFGNSEFEYSGFTIESAKDKPECDPVKVKYYMCTSNSLFDDNLDRGLKYIVEESSISVHRKVDLTHSPFKERNETKSFMFKFPGDVTRTKSREAFFVFEDISDAGL